MATPVYDEDGFEVWSPRTQALILAADFEGDIEGGELGDALYEDRGDRPASPSPAPGEADASFVPSTGLFELRHSPARAAAHTQFDAPKPATTHLSDSRHPYALTVASAQGYPEDEDDSTAGPSQRRGRGRPKGSKNKPKIEEERRADVSQTRDNEGQSGSAKRPVGRPPGTGPKQLERKAKEAAGFVEPEPAKRKPGRPRKVFTFGAKVTRERIPLRQPSVKAADTTEAGPSTKGAGFKAALNSTASTSGSPTLGATTSNYGALSTVSANATAPGVTTPTSTGSSALCTTMSSSTGLGSMALHSTATLAGATTLSTSHSTMPHMTTPHLTAPDATIANPTVLEAQIADLTVLGAPIADPIELNATITDPTVLNATIADLTVLDAPIADTTALDATTTDATAFSATTSTSTTSSSTPGETWPSSTTSTSAGPGFIGLKTVISGLEEEEEAEDVSDDEEDILAGLTGDGSGHDNEDVREGSKHQNTNQARTMPAWLQQAFNAAVAELVKNAEDDGTPHLYSRNKTIWLPRPMTFCVLQQNGITPELAYNPRFCYWDPERLVPGGIGCPTCHTKLRRHGFLHRPRRCVDWEESFWLIGVRYRCPSCVNPDSKKNTVTYVSWAPEIMQVIPPELAAEFPARLSHRSAISHPVFATMCSCSQHGLGSRQFSDILQAQHVCKYDQLQLQYLRSLVRRSGYNKWVRKTYKPFLPFEDDSDEGYYGFVPSSQWLRDEYDKLIEEHAATLNQHQSMRSAEVCGLDHSHKITRHVLQINGVQVFVGLLTLTNEKGEIRICALVATKSHSQFELALKEMKKSLDLFGLKQPSLIYTDNMADKQFLEASFPSLLEDLVPVEKYAHLEPLTLPDDVQILIRSSPSRIEEAVFSIVETLPDDGAITVGFDTEWNVDLLEGPGAKRRQTAVVQIAHDKQIYIFQIGHLLASNQLPAQFKALLSNPQIQKAGRLVDVDLRHLQNEVHSNVPFTGAVELSRLAKDREIVANAQASLSDLVAMVLGRRLDKNVPARVSTAWENENLSAEQIQYAALDAYASLLVYQELVKISAPGPLPQNPVPNSAVVLYQTDKSRLIARGTISHHALDPSYDGINITPTRTVICVDEVVVPGALITTHHKRPLSDFGATPFHIVCLKSHLRTAPPRPAISSPTPGQLPRSLSCDSHVQDTVSTVIDDAWSDHDAADGLRVGTSILADSQEQNSLSAPWDLIESAEKDADAEEEGRHLLGDSVLQSTSTAIRSRILKDPFHVFNMLYISRTHGLRVAFSRALRDAIFIPDPEDKMRICAYLRTLTPPQTWDDMLRSRASWLWRHCKRIIPPAETLYPLVARVFQTYGPLKDAKTGLPLFNTAAWHTAKNILVLIKNGYVSDPPGNWNSAILLPRSRQEIWRIADISVHPRYEYG